MDLVDEEVDDDDCEYRCMALSYLFVSFATPEAVAGEEESRYYTLKWLIL